MRRRAPVSYTHLTLQDGINTVGLTIFLIEFVVDGKIPGDLLVLQILGSQLLADCKAQLLVICLLYTSYFDQLARDAFRLDFSARMALARLEASAGLSPADRQWYCAVLVQ